jgi:hypothetical protein
MTSELNLKKIKLLTTVTEGWGLGLIQQMSLKCCGEAGNKNSNSKVNF